MKELYMKEVLTLCMLALMTVLTAPSSAIAKEDQADQAGLQVQRVALFKNGLGYWTSRAVLPDSARVNLGDLPATAHGTFWVSYDDGTPVRGVFARQEEVVRTEPLGTVAALLAANVGRKVHIGSIQGELLSVAGGMAVVRTQEGSVAVLLSQIPQVFFEGDDPHIDQQVTSKKSKLLLELDAPAPGATVGVSYLAKGITWAPSYSIDLSDPKTADLTAKAVVINDAVDLENVTLDLVTGYPNLQFADITSPLSAQQSVESFLMALRRHRQPNPYENSLAVQMTTNAMPSAAPIGPNYSATPTGEAAEDLFFYPVEGITLRRGEKALLPLLQAEIPYEHVYTWDVADILGRRNHYSQSKEPKNEVWHSFRFVNKTGIPLTTAPAQFTRNGQIVGQDLLHYTLRDGTTTVRINKALGLVVDHVEHEIARKREAVHIYNDTYDKVTIQGELMISNRLGKEAQLEVSKSIEGELGKSSHPPMVRHTTQGLRTENPSLDLLWNLKLGINEEITVTYEYVVLVDP